MALAAVLVFKLCAMTVWMHVTSLALLDCPELGGSLPCGVG